MQRVEVTSDGGQEGVEVLPAKRQAKTLEFLRKERFASLPELARLVGVSTSTVRRDVDMLCEQGHLYRTYGGASLRENEVTTVEPAPEVSSEIAREAKIRIGHHAAEIIQPGQTVILETGTTTLEVARAALDLGVEFTAMTNDLAIAGVLARSSTIAVHVPGGQARPGSSTLLGGVCARAFTRIRVDLAFVGAHAISAQGASETSTEHSEIKRSVLEAADETVLVVDSSKFYSRSLSLFASLEDFSRILTDDGLSSEVSRDLDARGHNVEVLS